MKNYLSFLILIFFTVSLFSQENMEDSSIQITNKFISDDGFIEAIILSSDLNDTNFDSWLAKYIEETHSRLLKENSEKKLRASACGNLDFENGNFTGWTCQTGKNNGYPAGNWTGSAPVANRHTIETGGTDPYGGFPKVAPGGGTYSVRLGNNGTGAQAERLIFSFIVGPEDTNFIYKYAVVFEDPGHPENEQPYFELQILNSQNQIISCGQQHYTAASNIPGFINAGGMVWYKPWTTVGIRLANYVGQPVTVIVTNADCSRSGHFGYGYVDFICPHDLVAQANTFCENDSSATLQVPNISPGATYLWSTGETTSTININPQNFNDSVIQCYVTPPDVPVGCGFWYTFPIKILHIDPHFSFTTSCLNAEFYDSTLINYGNVTYWNWNFGDGNTASIQNPTHAFPATGTYNVTLTSGTPQCQNSITYPLTVTDFDLNISKIDVTCFEYTDGQATAIINGGTAPFSFQWSNGQNTQSISNLSVGTYSVTVSDNNGCMHTASVTINQPPQLVITANANPVLICQGDITNLSVSGASTYNWSNGLGNGITVTASPTITTTYTVTGSDTIGCTATTEVTVSVNPTPDISPTSDQTLCHNTQTTAINFTSSVPNTVFNWINNNSSIGLAANGTGDISSFTVTNTGTAPQTSTIIATPSFTNNGLTCTGQSDTFLIIVNPTPDISPTSDQTLCHNTQTTAINFTSFVPNTVFNWINNNSSIGLAANGTGDISSFTVTNTGTAPQTSTIIVTPSFTNNGLTCTGQSDTFLIIVNPVPALTMAQTDTVICYGKSVLISVSGAMTYQWSNNLGNNSTILVTPDANSTYSVTGTNQYGCTSSVSASIVVNPVPDVGINPDSIEICDNTTITLVASGANTYLWAGGLGANASITITPHNTTTYVVTGTNQYGCTSSARSKVIVHPLPVVTINPNNSEICLGDTISLVANGAQTYLWSGGLGTNNSLSVSPQVSTTYNVTGTNQWGCTASVSANIIVHPLPNLTISPHNISICYGESTTLTANGAHTYQWSNGSSNQSITVEPLFSTTYYLTGYSIYECVKIDSAQVMVNPKPIIDFIAEPLSGCEPLSVKFINNSDNGTYYWYFGDGNSSNIYSPIHIYNNDGVYTVTLIVKNQYNCSDTLTKFNYITIYPSPIAGFSIFPLITTEDDGRVKILDESYGATSWYYDFGEENEQNDIFTDREPNYIYTNAGNYTIIQIVANEYNCYDTAYNNVIIKPSTMFYIANSFTPNADGLNETFMPLGFNVPIKDYEFRIFDRWGKQLFYTTDLYVGWDGKYKDEFVKQDMYVYSIKVILEDGEHIFRGALYVIY
ncbi:MAG: PKD domain-containing protein [Bacteroidota bacterium]|jgi:gliding motility-associated-like protein|nr:PKD domain-containing protein [Bacteroidota bacterium]MDY0401052.1 PKD domain-containing protein [Bacteroidales bacterium]